MIERRLLGLLAGILTGIVLLAVGYFTRPYWQTLFSGAQSTIGDDHADHDDHEHDSERVKLTPEGRANLGLISGPVTPTTSHRRIEVPGTVIDQPGYSDRGVATPVAGVVSKIHIKPGDLINPDAPLFTLHLVSEHLQQTQIALFRTVSEREQLESKRERLQKAVSFGGVEEEPLILVKSDLKRLESLGQVYRHELARHGMTPTQIDEAARGKPADDIVVLAPPTTDRLSETSMEGTQPRVASAFEVQEIRAQLGQLVQPGQVLGVLANHRYLYIEGHSFKKEAPLIERAAREGWEIEVEFAEDNPDEWPPLNQSLHIRHLGNNIDPVSRTFGFYITLINQSRTYEKDGQTFLLWRFRPGQRVRLRIPVEEFKDVIELPAEAVVREGPEAYIFRQNGDLFERKPVQVLHEDRLKVIIPADSVPTGVYIAHNSAAALNRVLRAQSSEGDDDHHHHHH